ncbi:uncharacterized protein LOC110990100 [Acanthaster planci]|uniref:Uncharacterized protein LOC110990100 n=1 Tax=Acanthaster planci TaxID=133434 RepID=A0A8B8A3Z5_ACAPL|nr:uncharacterized protein LOC110990100 [Acanthaster planci]
MAGEFTVGKRVQAVDELGRWCSARVVAVDDGEGLGTLVSFPGFRGHDILATPDRIRQPTLPIEEQHRRGCRPRAGRRNLEQKCTSQQLRFMAHCQAGDLIHTQDKEGTIAIVDPFNRTLKLHDGDHINLYDVVLPGCEQPPEKKCKKRKHHQIKGDCGHQQQPTVASKSVVQGAVQENHAQPSSYQQIHPQCNENQEENDNQVFRVGHHQCGKVHKVSY